VDGTIYRFLPTYEGSSFHPLTGESWSDENRKAWESSLKNALSWADAHRESEELILSEDAQRVFFDWRNDLFQTKDDLPAQVQGFIPKLVGYALRFAGVLYLMHRFSNQGQGIGGTIHRDFIEKGIRVSEFYLGHIICAMDILIEDVSSPLEPTEQVVHLARTLEDLKPDLDSGRLAIGYIWEKFNESCKPELNVKTAKAMGSLLRTCKLTVPGRCFDANGRRGVFCLQWDEKTNTFIKTSPQSPQSPQSQEYQGLQPADIEKLKSAKSASADVHGDDLRTLRTLRTTFLRKIKNQSNRALKTSGPGAVIILTMVTLILNRKRKHHQKMTKTGRCSTRALRAVICLKHPTTQILPTSQTFLTTHRTILNVKSL